MQQMSMPTRLNTRILVLAFLALSFTISTQGQQIDFSKMSSLKARSIGPANMSGRVTSIDVVRSQPNVIYAGSASGGLWKSESGGVHWEPIFDSEIALSIGAVAVSQKSPDVVWVGTGEGNPRNSLTGGYGVYRSLDAGKTWELMGLEKTRNVHRIIIHPDDPNTVYIGAIGSPWGDHEERGVFKTTDAGKTWEKILYVDQMTGVGDMVMDPSNPDKLLVNMWQHRRKPWFFESGGESSGLYITLDGGQSWKKQTAKENGLPAGELGRMGLAFATNRPNRVYALIEAKDNALYRSDDGGFSWTMINDKGEIGNRPFYYFDIYVDPQNENRLYSIFTNVNVSEDGGKSFSQLIGRGLIHVDNHALYINPDDPDYMILGNDGGMGITRDRGKTWQFVENLPLGQFYHVNVDNETPYNVYGGLQDNGSYTGPAYAWIDGGLRNDYYYSIGGGDGFDVVPDPEDSRYGYAMSQQGNVFRYDKLTGRSETVKPNHPDPDVRLRFNWNAAIAQDPFDGSTLYFGSQFVHKSTNKGSSWSVISPDLTTNDPEKQKQHLSGGLTIDATGAENYTTILAIEPSAREQGVIWAGTDDGNVQITRDGGATWTNVAKNIKGVPEGSWVNQIRASRYNDGEAVVVINNYRRFDFKPYVYRTTNYGRSWQPLVNESNVFGYALSFVQDPVEPKLMFLGTEHGLYMSIDGADTWTRFNNGYPSVSTMDLVIQEEESDLVMGTFGRGIYVLDDIQPLRVLAANGQETVLNSDLMAVSNKVGYIVSTRSASGPANPGNATFQGENRPEGSAHIKFFAKKPEVPDSVRNRGGGPGNMTPEMRQRMRRRMQAGGGGRRFAAMAGRSTGPQAKVEIMNSNGDVIRSIDHTLAEGLNAVEWSFDEDLPKGDAEMPIPEGFPPRLIRRFLGTSIPALPGTYQVKITVGETSVNSEIEIRMDPREEVSMDALIARREMLRESGELRGEISTMVAKISEDLKTVNKVLTALQGKRGPEARTLRERTNEVKKEMETLQKGVGSMDFRSMFGGGNPDEGTPLLARALMISRYISGSYNAPGETPRMLMDQARTKMKEFKESMDAWYNENWDAYLESVKKVDFSPIGEEN